MDVVTDFIKAIVSKEMLDLFLSFTPLIFAGYAGYFSGLICYIIKPYSEHEMKNKNVAASSSHLQIKEDVGVCNEFYSFLCDLVKMRPGKKGWRYVVSTYDNTEEAYHHIVNRLSYDAALSAMFSVVFIVMPKAVEALEPVGMLFR